MKKVILTICGAVLLAASLAGCCMKHEWAEATCTEPKKCVKCGETEGVANGHKWKAATCTTPKTCETCGKTEGEALGHKWVDRTLEKPKTCSVCGATEGKPIAFKEVVFPIFDANNYKSILFLPETIVCTDVDRAVMDIYDSLIADDRPYKKPKSNKVAFEIIEEEAEAGKLDKEIVKIAKELYLEEEQ